MTHGPMDAQRPLVCQLAFPWRRRRFLGFLSRGTSLVGPGGMGMRAGVRRRGVFATDSTRVGHARETGLAMCSRSGSNTNAGASERLNPPRADAPAFVSAHRVWFESAPFSPLPFPPPNVVVASDAGSTSDSGSSIPHAFSEHVRSTSTCGPRLPSQRVIAWGAHPRM